MDDDELKKIVETAKKRDPGALSKLYEIYFDRIYRYILIRVGNVTDAEDLASQVFLKMVERIDSFEWPRGGGAFSGWLFRIAHNLVVDRFRVGGRTTPLADTEIQGGPTPEDLAAQDESIRQVLAIVNELSEDQRQTLLLRLIGGLSTRETAAVMATTEGNVRILQYRALGKVREKLRVVTNV